MRQQSKLKRIRVQERRMRASQKSILLVPINTSYRQSSDKCSKAKGRHSVSSKLLIHYVVALKYTFWYPRKGSFSHMVIVM